MGERYLLERESLLKLFPNGRFFQTSEDACILAAPHSSPCHLFTDKSGHLYLYVPQSAEEEIHNRLAGHIVRTLERTPGIPDCVLELKRSREVADLLSEFSYDGAPVAPESDAEGAA